MIFPQALDQPAAAREAGHRLRERITQEEAWELARSRGVGARDARLAQQVEQLLAAEDPGRLKSVLVEVAGCCLRLSGTVGTYYAKQLAQAAAMNVEGVNTVLNRIEVE